MSTSAEEVQNEKPLPKWRSFLGSSKKTPATAASEAGTPTAEDESIKGTPTKWSMGVLNDRITHEVPGSVLLLTKRNEPLGLQNAPARTSTSSIYSRRPTEVSLVDQVKKTKDGAIILVPQPDDSNNDPLNWSKWRRDLALLSIGFYSLVGGGMTPVLAAGFTNVAATYNVTVPEVALTTGLYMMGLGIGSVLASPTAILYGKRPVYLVGAVLFMVTSVWCAASPTYMSLVLGRVFMGIAISPVECLPSATIAEIFFLHERAYRIGIYTLLLLGGKNLVPLVSAAIIQTLEWRWVFWIVTMVVGFCFITLFFFVPETFWDRTPRPKNRKDHHKMTMPWSRRQSRDVEPIEVAAGGDSAADDKDQILPATSNSQPDSIPPGARPQVSRTMSSGFASLASRPPTRNLHVGFAPGDGGEQPTLSQESHHSDVAPTAEALAAPEAEVPVLTITPAQHEIQNNTSNLEAPPTPSLHNFNSPFYEGVAREDENYMNRGRPSLENPPVEKHEDISSLEKTIGSTPAGTAMKRPPGPKRYTTYLKEQPRQTFLQQLKPFNGRLHKDRWIRVAVRPFILFCYPAVLWSAIVYACSVGWLIVLSESATTVYRSANTYNFSALSTGLIYISPFIGGVLGTAVAGKVSDIIVRAMSRRNGGLYEPEFRLVMAAPVAVTTVIGLMGFGWSAQIHDAWIVPTLFFGVISFGCSLGSTTAITFCVDSYRQYAGEALVTLNFSKNIFHGLVFSLFFNNWLLADGSRKVFICLGVIQLCLMTLTVPMYIYGKRARMWTYRMNLMEKF